MADRLTFALPAFKDHHRGQPCSRDASHAPAEIIQRADLGAVTADLPMTVVSHVSSAARGPIQFIEVVTHRVEGVIVGHHDHAFHPGT